MATDACMIEESGLRFQFEAGVRAIKFDDTGFYRKYFNKLPEGKGVDILADSKDIIQLIEIKNCLGHENENMWRTSVNNSRIQSAPRELDVESRNSLDIEVAQKVASTIACLHGAWTKSEHSENAAGLVEFWQGISDQRIARDKKRFMVVLFLEGDFNSEGPNSRSKKTMMKRLQDSISAKLEWLNCQVTVVDSSTYKERYFKVS